MLYFKFKSLLIFKRLITSKLKLKKFFYFILQSFRSLTAIKIAVLADLDKCRKEISYRQSQILLQTNRIRPDERNSVLSYVDDDTFALLYGVFGVKASTVRYLFKKEFFS